MKLPVYETFWAFQGEGAYAGTSAYFIRLFGCPVKCPWCDSAGTWHPDYKPDHIERIEVEELARRFHESEAEYCVITGGEPAIHDLTELCNALERGPNGKRRFVHIETSGAFPLKGNFRWITVSPKWNRLPLPDVLENAQEIKIIVDTPTAVADWIAKLKELIPDKMRQLEKGYHMHPSLVFNPEWGQRFKPEILNQISDIVKKNPRYRAGYQLHKLYQVDLLDAGSKPIVPLGGDPSKGY